ncbi:HAD family hydrolase [Streptomyces sp. NPDC003077]|uniref:HAD family hydrolase n=1 Tax=Streptomyces sp. NPDC003077 TaxID=3154443 RepID=UPI0033BDD713
MITLTPPHNRATGPAPDASARTGPRAAGLPAPTAHELLAPCHALVIGVEGVITDTTRIHAAAWRRVFDAFLRQAEEPHPRTVRPFDPETDYRRYFQGRSRADGVRAFLAARGLGPPGEPRAPSGRDHRDEDGESVVRALAIQEDCLFGAYVGDHGVPVWPDSLRLVGALRRHARPVAAVSASHHAVALLDRAGVTHRFDALVDGTERTRIQSGGGPDPALLLEAARRLRATPARTAVVVAAPVWVTAAGRGGFGTVIGVDRSGRADHAVELYERGAAHVVRGLGELVPEG